MSFRHSLAYSRSTSLPQGSRMSEWRVRVAYRSSDATVFAQVGSSIYAVSATPSGLAQLDTYLRKLADTSGSYPFTFVPGIVKVAPRGRGTKKPIQGTERAPDCLLADLEARFEWYNAQVPLSSPDSASPDVHPEHPLVRGFADDETFSFFQPVRSVASGGKRPIARSPSFRRY